MTFKELRDRINELWDNEMISEEAEVYLEDYIEGLFFDPLVYIGIDEDGDLVLASNKRAEEE